MKFLISFLLINPIWYDQTLLTLQSAKNKFAKKAVWFLSFSLRALFTFSTSETISENLSLLNPAISHSTGSDSPSPKFPDVFGLGEAQRPDKTLRWLLLPRKAANASAQPYDGWELMMCVCVSWCAVPLSLLGIIMMPHCQVKLMPVN